MKVIAEAFMMAFGFVILDFLLGRDSRWSRNFILYFAVFAVLGAVWELIKKWYRKKRGPSACSRKGTGIP